MRNKKFFNIWISGYAANLVLEIALAVLLAAMGVILSDVADLANIYRYFSAPLLFALNAFPLLLLMLALYHLTSRHWVSFGLGGGLYLLLHIINKFKIQLREEPLNVLDITLGMEAAKVVKLTELPFGPAVVLSIIFWFFAGLFLFAFVKSKKLRPAARIAGAVIPPVLFAVSFAGLYKNAGMYDSFRVTGSVYSIVDQYKSRGFLYSFLFRAGALKSLKPAGYSEEEAEKILAGYENPSYPVVEGKLPHIIAVMGEAFYDMDRIPGIKFNDGLNPLENFNRIAGQAYSGRIVAEVYGGGTANTEFSFLTGHSMAVMPQMSSPYSYYIRRNTFSLARALESAGYAAMAFHPGESWFYNRVNVYKYFGFNDIYFKRDMDLNKVEFYHGYVSDMDTVKFTLEKFARHLAEKPGTPLFEFVVNIDNHGPYSDDDLGYPEILEKDGSMDEATYNVVNNYLNGLMRCDKALGYLADSLGKMDEPVVLLYFSDHLPALGEAYKGYKALGFEIGGNSSLKAFLNLYGTPYFIWCNDAAKRLLTGNGIAPPKGEAPEISVNYLATELLKYVGVNGGRYFNYLAEQKKNWPVVTNRFYKKGGRYFEKHDAAYLKLMEQYSKLQYYMLMGKGDDYAVFEPASGTMDESAKKLLNGVELHVQSTIRIKGEKTIYFDPWKVDGKPADADAIFISHSHYDHFSPTDIKKLMKTGTVLVVPESCVKNAKDAGLAGVMGVLPGKSYEAAGIKFETVPAYNSNKSFHKKEDGFVGYIANINGVRYYFAGDTDNIPEMKNIKADVAFLPVGGTYTMTSGEAAAAANVICPKVAVPMHYGDIVGTKKDAEDFIKSLSAQIKGVLLK